MVDFKNLCFEKSYVLIITQLNSWMCFFSFFWFRSILWQLRGCLRNKMPQDREEWAGFSLSEVMKCTRVMYRGGNCLCRGGYFDFLSGTYGLETYIECKVSRYQSSNVYMISCPLLTLLHPKRRFTSFGIINIYIYILLYQMPRGKFREACNSRFRTTPGVAFFHRRTTN